jgi:hypothetical protein
MAAARANAPGPTRDEIADRACTTRTVDRLALLEQCGTHSVRAAAQYAYAVQPAMRRHCLVLAVAVVVVTAAVAIARQASPTAAVIVGIVGIAIAAVVIAAVDRASGRRG